MAYRAAPKVFYGWKDDGKYYLSLEPRGTARNEYMTANDALREASRRGRGIAWEDPSVIS